MSQSSGIPIYKVGLVLLRNLRASDPLVCLTQVKAKNPAEQQQVKFGLPKGTRRYRAADGTLHDARDEALATQHADRLEPLLDCLKQEASEEVGLPPSVFHVRAPNALGSRPFVSESGGPSQDIHWYALVIDDAMAKNMHPTPPDAHAVRWVRLSEMQQMAARGEVNKSYVPVADSAIAQMRQAKP